MFFILILECSDLAVNLYIYVEQKLWMYIGKAHLVPDICACEILLSTIYASKKVFRCKKGRSHAFGKYTFRKYSFRNTQCFFIGPFAFKFFSCPQPLLKNTIIEHSERHVIRVTIRHDLGKCSDLRNSASSFHWLSSSIFSYCPSRIVTTHLISTIWCFRPYKPYIFCEDMILATCQCHSFRVEPSLLLSSFNCTEISILEKSHLRWK